MKKYIYHLHTICSARIQTYSNKLRSPIDDNFWMLVILYGYFFFFSCMVFIGYSVQRYRILTLFWVRFFRLFVVVSSLGKNSFLITTEINVCPQSGSSPLPVPWSVVKRTGTSQPIITEGKRSNKQTSKQNMQGLNVPWNLILGHSDFCYTFAQFEELAYWLVFECLSLYFSINQGSQKQRYWHFSPDKSFLCSTVLAL